MNMGQFGQHVPPNFYFCSHHTTELFNSAANLLYSVQNTAIYIVGTFGWPRSACSGNIAKYCRGRMLRRTPSPTPTSPPINEMASHAGKQSDKQAGGFLSVAHHTTTPHPPTTLLCTSTPTAGAMHHSRQRMYSDRLLRYLEMPL
jgi:hypothetical protein